MPQKGTPQDVIGICARSLFLIKRCKKFLKGPFIDRTRIAWQAAVFHGVGGHGRDSLYIGLAVRSFRQFADALRHGHIGHEGLEDALKEADRLGHRQRPWRQT